MKSSERVPPSFCLSVIDLDDQVRELKVEGELDLAVADRLRDEIGQAGARAVLVDLSDCTFIDSTGIAAVLLARREGACIAVHSPSEEVLRILSITGLTGDSLVFAGREEARSALSGRGAD